MPRSNPPMRASQSHQLAEDRHAEGTSALGVAISGVIARSNLLRRAGPPRARSRSSGAWATPLIDRSDQPQWRLNHLKGPTGLHTLDLGFTSVGDPGLAHLAGMVSLDTPDLAGAKVTDAREKPAGDPVELPWLEYRDFVSEVTS